MAKGKEGVERAIQLLERDGVVLVRREVTFKTPHGRRRVDAVFYDRLQDKFFGIEVKNGRYARYSRLQRTKDAELGYGAQSPIGWVREYLYAGDELPVIPIFYR